MKRKDPVGVTWEEINADPARLTLMVVAEVAFESDKRQTRNPSVDAIIAAYAKRFKKVVYVAPALRWESRINAIADNVIVYGTPLYSKSFSKRLEFIARRKRAGEWLRRIVDEEGVDLIQLRLPSVFSLVLSSYALGLRPVTTYIAGDWEESFAANYQFPFSALIGQVLDGFQRDIIKRSVPVTTGPVLLEKYRQIALCHPYFSTSHNQIYSRDISRIPSKLIFLGRLEPRKRVIDAVEAVRILRTKGHDVSLRIVGDGPERESLEKRCHDSKLQEHVHFTGYIWDQDQLRREWLIADLLVFPSVTEGTPKVVAEAMAHGVVPIAVRTAGSNRYIIDDGENGFLVDERRPDQIAGCIRELREHPGRLSRMAEKAYSYASEHTVETEMERMWDFVIRSVIRTLDKSRPLMIRKRQALDFKSPGMRICFIIPSLGGGGAERVVQRLSTEFIRRGHEVAVVLLDPAPIKYELSPDVRVLALAASRFSRGVGKILAMPVLARELSTVFRQNAFDASLSLLPRGNIVHVMAGKRLNRRVVISEHSRSDRNYRSGSLRGRLMRWLIRSYYPLSDELIAVSSGILGGLKEMNVPLPNRTTVIYNPIDLCGITTHLGTKPLRSGRFRLIAVGRLIPQKDYPTLLAAFEQIIRLKDAELVILGDGPLRKEIEAKVHSMGLAGRVILKGWVSDPYHEMSSADVFVLSSQSEGFGNVIIEAMACGLPVVCTDCESGPREILQDGRFGRLVPVGDSTALANAILELLDNPDERRRLAEEGRRHVQDFDVRRIADQFESVLRVTIAQPST